MSERTREDRAFQCDTCGMQYGVPVEKGTDPFPCRHCDTGTARPMQARQ